MAGAAYRSTFYALDFAATRSNSNAFSKFYFYRNSLRAPCPPEQSYLCRVRLLQFLQFLISACLVSTRYSMRICCIVYWTFSYISILKQCFLLTFRSFSVGISLCASNERAALLPARRYGGALGGGWREVSRSAPRPHAWLATHAGKQWLHSFTQRPGVVAAVLFNCVIYAHIRHTGVSIAVLTRF